MAGDAIDEFIALPREQQMSTLQGLAPDKQDKLLAKIKERKSAKPAGDSDDIKIAGNGPEERTVGNYAKEIGAGVGRGIKNDVVGIGQAVAHPLATAEGLMQQANESGEAAGKEFRDLKGVPLGQRLGATALAGLEKAPIIGGMVQHAEEGGERMGSPEAAGAAAEGITTFAAPEAIGPMTKVLKAIPKKAVDIVSGTGEGATKDLVKRTKEGNAAAVEKTAKENEATKQKNKSADEKTLEERGKVDQANVDIKKKNTDAVVEDVQKQSKVARRGEAEKELKTVGSNLDVSIEKARHDALEEGNKKYSGVNEKMNGVQADPDAVGAALGDAEDALRGSTRDTALLKDMSKAYFGDIDKGGTLKAEGRNPTYEDLQGDYSRLGKELSKGTLPGDVFHAYDKLHEALGTEMQRLADEKGVGGGLTTAREYWRRMKRTFGKSADPVNNRAAKAAQAADPSVLKRQAADYRKRLLSSFDPKIGEMMDHADKLRQEIGSLPKKGADEAGPESVKMDKAKEYGEPNATKPLEKAETRKITPGEIQVAKAEAMAKKAEAFRAPHSKFANTIVALDIIRNAITGNVAGIAKDIAVRGIYGLGKQGIARLLENKTVVDMLTKTTPADLALVPPELREDFPNIIEAAEAKGMKVSPRLKAAFAKTAKGAAYTGPMTQRLQEIRNGNPQSTQQQ